MSTSVSVGSAVSTMFATLFWLSVNLSFLATSLGLIFFPKEAAELFPLFKHIVESECWKETSNVKSANCAISISPLIHGVTNTEAVQHVRLLIRTFGFIFLYATGGFNQCLSDAFLHSNSFVQRFIFSLTTFYYLTASVGLLIVVSMTSVINHDAAIVVQVLVSMFLAALALGLIGTWISCCFTFVEILPGADHVITEMMSRKSRLPASRAAMAGV